MRIMGIDPGTAIVGYGIIDTNVKGYITIDYGCIFTDKSMEKASRLLQIYNELSLLIEKYKPNEIAIEDLFFNKNSKTVISVGEARGVILLLAAMNNIKTYSYTPLQVKQAVVGFGQAEKKQVQEMVKRILKLEQIPKPDDAADALAIAIMHANINLNRSLINSRM